MSISLRFDKYLSLPFELLTKPKSEYSSPSSKWMVDCKPESSSSSPKSMGGGVLQSSGGTFTIMPAAKFSKRIP